MNACKLLFVSISILVCILLSACAPATPAAPPAPTVLAEWRVNLPEDIALGFDSAWIAEHRDPKSTIRIDANTNQVTATIENTGSLAGSVLIVGDSVWVDGFTDDMSKIDPKTNRVVARVNGSHTGLAYAFDSIWSPTVQGQLDRIDPATAKIITSIELSVGHEDCRNSVVVTALAVGVLHCDGAELIKVDPTTNAVVSKTPYAELIKQAKLQKTRPQGQPTDFAWLVTQNPDNPRGCGLLQIDTDLAKGVAFWSVGDDCNPPAVTGKSIWLSGNSQIDHFNTATNTIDRTYELQPGISGLKAGFNSIWVLYEPIGLVQRLDIVP